MNKTHLYFPINKCGSTSLKYILKKYNHIIIPNLDLNNKNCLKYIKTTENYNKYYKFTIIRHPYDRFISSINMFIRDNKLIYNNNKEEYINKIINIIKNYKTHEFNTLNGYIKRHTLPLCHELYSIVENNKIVCDYVIKMENLNIELENMKKNLNININNIPIKNKTEHIIKLNDITSEQKDFLYNYYKKDFDLFNYKC